jgi:hypothetical protein
MIGIWVKHKHLCPPGRGKKTNRLNGDGRRPSHNIVPGGGHTCSRLVGHRDLVFSAECMRHDAPLRKHAWLDPLLLLNAGNAVAACTHTLSQCPRPPNVFTSLPLSLFKLFTLKQRLCKGPRPRQRSVNDLQSSLMLFFFLPEQQP